MLCCVCGLNPTPRLAPPRPSRDAIPETSSPRRHPRDTIPESSSQRHNPRDTLPETPSQKQNSRDTIPETPSPTHYPRNVHPQDTIPDTLSPRRYPRDAIPETHCLIFFQNFAMNAHVFWLSRNCDEVMVPEAYMLPSAASVAVLTASAMDASSSSP
jgi:hypothetical protein